MNPKTSSGEPWSLGEDDVLRRAWVELCAGFPTRSEAALRSRLALLAERNYHNQWPNEPLAPECGVRCERLYKELKA